MGERPILFSAPMVRAILEGTKTQTRRVVTVPWRGSRRALPYEPYWCDEDGRLLAVDEYGDYHEASEVMAPYGAPGDRLWVRETWTSGHAAGCWGTIFAADGAFAQGARQHEKGPHYNANDRPPGMRWRPSIFMPRWASRITLEIAEVRVERLQAITTQDAFAEGVEQYEGCRSSDEAMGWDPVEHYAKLWDSINGKRAPWSSNPWVWVIGFRRLEAA